MFRTIIVEQAVVWGDMDAFGHVNNVVFLRYFETSRVKYFENYMQSNEASSIIPVVVSIQAQYKKQVKYPDLLEVHCSISKIGNTSLDMEALMYNQNKELVFSAQCTVVMIQKEKARPVAIPVSLKDWIHAC
jgi:acyl-CoA thioester hydrolase